MQLKDSWEDDIVIARDCYDTDTWYPDYKTMDMSDSPSDTASAQWTNLGFSR